MEYNDEDDDYVLEWERNGRSRSIKRCKSPKEDCISRLPDSMIHQILSLLPMQDAVKTGVLSKRWKYLWTSIPTLDFCYEGNSYENFCRFIDKTLILYSSPKIKKFSLSYDFSSAIGSEDGANSVVASVGLWLHFATRHDVEDLSLILSKDENDTHSVRYSIPQYLYAHSSLTNLTTSFCEHSPNAEVCWASLKVLKIGLAELTEYGFQRILAGAPLLEHLELNRCWGLYEIDISSTSVLKKLVIRAWKRVPHRYNTLQISIPSVKLLELLGYWQTKCTLLDVSSLLEATLDFALLDDHVRVGYEGMLKKVLQDVTLVPKLTVGHMLIHALSCSSKALASSWRWRSLICKSLTLAVRFEKSICLGIYIFLKGSPNLEKLVIDLSAHHYQCPNAGTRNEEENFWSSKKKSFQHWLKQLKTIEIVGLDPTEDVGANCLLFQFAQFLLQKAKVLEKIVIHRHPNRKANDYYGVARKFLGFHRSSPNAEIILPE